MIKDLRNTLKQTFIYGLSNIAIKAAGLILLPFYTGSLSVSEYGELAILEIFAQFFVGVISLQIPSAVLRFGSEIKSPGELRKIYSTALLSAAAFVVVFAFIALPFAKNISELIFNSPVFKIHITLVIFSIASEVLGLLPLQLLRLKEKSIQYLLFIAFKLAVLLGLVWYFVVFKDEKVLGAVKAILGTNLIFLAATLPLQFRNSSIQFNKDYGIRMYRYGAPLVFTTISAVLLTISDRLILKIYGEFADVGIYTLAYKIGSLSNLLIIASFSLGFLPIAFKKLEDMDFKPFFSKTLTLYIALTILLTLVISVFGYELTKLLSSGEEAYWVAAILVPFIAFLFIFKALNNYFSYIFLLTKKTKYHARITVIGVLANILLNFVLVPKYGMYGAVAATGLSYLTMAIMTHYLANKQMKIGYEYQRIALLMVSSAIVIAIALLSNEYSLAIRGSVKVLLMIIYVFFLYRIVATPSERTRLNKVLNLLKSRKGIVKLINESKIS